jgi:outer membrane protein assembly factor BamA
MKNKGYYYATIRDSVFFTGKKAHVIYYVEGGKPYTIRNISHSIEDTTIRRIYLADSANTLLKPGELFDKDVLLQNERIRIERLLKTNGYYNFSREYVVFYADTFPATHQVDLQVQIQNPFNSL